MKDYQSLLKALVTVIVRYNLSIQGNTQLKEENALVMNILDKPSIAEMKQTLGQQVRDATSGEGGLRKTLHEYLYFTALSLKRHIDSRQYSQLNQALSTVYKPLLQFFCHIQLLLNTHQNSCVMIQFNGKLMPVAGLQNGIISSSSMCRSGKLLQDNIFAPLGLDCNSSKERLKQIVIFLEKAHQADILARITERLQCGLKEAQDKLENTEKKLIISQRQLEASLILTKSYKASDDKKKSSEPQAPSQSTSKHLFWPKSPTHHAAAKFRINNPLQFMAAVMDIFTQSLKRLAAQYESQLKKETGETSEEVEKKSL